MSCRQPGDWDCRRCRYLNFSKRDSCQRCGEPKVGLGAPGLDYSTGGGALCNPVNWAVKPGDWYCYNCGVHNYASRSNCFKCGGATKTDSAVTQSWGFSHEPAQQGWKSGDWICSRMGCNEHNYASRTECFRCSTPRYYG
ncbi:hypothetical protein LUZ63_019171 [Rhynchospora breviuscula]|uniref:RanBP2-type domain-containing protein n=1 Tax=Rhynchospora breviuscula TaxID=2022672 RepID=A0A9Q0C5Q3_9POAL|nr:hypothetical protein LUZ63_019171 [Rhynchospora breviuscula]